MTQVLSEERQAHLVSVVDHWSPSMLRRGLNTADGRMYSYAACPIDSRAIIDQWCALYGDNLQDGVAGFGKSPQDAMWDFDAQWGKALEPKKSQADANALLDSLGFPSTHGIKP